MTSLPDLIRARIEDRRHASPMGAARAVYPPVPLTAVAAAEAALGFRLPTLLRELYTQVANGGSGPGYGLYGLAGGAPAHDGGGNEYDLVEFYHLYRGQGDLPELRHDFSQGSLFLSSQDRWYDKLLPICHWGCDLHSLIDCSRPEAPVIHYVGYGGELLLEAASFATWMQAWLAEPLPGPELPAASSDDELRRLVRDGRIISAMIRYQESTRCTLQEARRYVASLE